MTEQVPLTIRTPNADDRDAWEALWRAYLTFYETSVSADVYDWTWAQILGEKDAMHARLALVGNTPVGLVHFLYHRTFWGPDQRCYLNDLFTTPDARGRGVAQGLIEAVYDHARAAGSTQVYWLTAEDNLRARALYDRVAKKTPFIKYTEQM